MCEPTTIALAATALGTAATAYGQYQQGQAAKSAGNYQAAVMRNNAIAAEQAAQDAEARGKEAAAQQQLKTRQIQGRQLAVLAGNGVDVGKGSSLNLLGDTAASGELDAATLLNNSQREAAYYRNQGMNFSADATLAQAKGDSAAQAGLIGAGATVLSGAGSVANKWYQFKQAGAFGPKTYDFSNTNNSTILWNQ